MRFSRFSSISFKNNLKKNLFEGIQEPDLILYYSRLFLYQPDYHNHKTNLSYHYAAV